MFRRESDGARRVMSLDEMLTHLDAWDRTAERRSAQRRVYHVARDIERRLVADRRAALAEAEQLRRRASDFASLDAELPPAPKDADQTPGKRVPVEREKPLPFSAEPRPVTEPQGEKPAKRKRRQREGPPKSKREAAPKPKREAAPRARREAAPKPKREAAPKAQREGTSKPAPEGSPKPRSRRAKGDDDKLNPAP